MQHRNTWAGVKNREETDIFPPFASDELCSGVDSALTFVKEGDVVVLHRPKVEVLPEIGLLRGVGRQKTLSMESLLCSPGVERRIRREALLICSDEATCGAHLQRPGGQTSALCSESG